MAPDAGEVMQLLAQYRLGDRRALDRLMPLVYDELRRLAAYHLRAERPDHSLSPTALVHEAYLRLFAHPGAEAHDGAHFMALAAQVMRHVLVDYARARGREKRGGQFTILALEEVGEGVERAVDLGALDDALTELAGLNPQQARVVELRYFGGLTIEQIAAALEISPAKVRREWTFARAWLRRALKDEGYDS
jgi:RNA polymerase sigma factor (TIGR02999 family)